MERSAGRPQTLTPEQRAVLARILKELRDKDFQGRQDVLAAALETTATTMSRYINGNQSPTPELLARITELAGLDTDDILKPDPSGNYAFGAAARFARRAGYPEAAIDRARSRIAQYPAGRPAQFLRLIENESDALQPASSNADEDDD